MSKTIKELVGLNDYVETKRLAMYNSLKEAVIECGGRWDGFEALVANGMTVFELIDMLAQNHVLFVCKKERT